MGPSDPLKKYQHNLSLFGLFAYLTLSLSDCDIDSDVYVLVFADHCVRTKEALVIV